MQTTLQLVVQEGAFEAMAEAATANGLALIEIEATAPGYRTFLVRRAES